MSNNDDFFGVMTGSTPDLETILYRGWIGDAGGKSGEYLQTDDDGAGGAHPLVSIAIDSISGDTSYYLGVSLYNNFTTGISGTNIINVDISGWGYELEYGSSMGSYDYPRIFNLRIYTVGEDESIIDTLFDAKENSDPSGFDVGDYENYLTVPGDQGGGPDTQIRWFEIKIGTPAGAGYSDFRESVVNNISGGHSPNNPVTINLTHAAITSGGGIQLRIDTHIYGRTTLVGYKMPFCAERAAEIKTDQGIYNIEDLDSSHTINGLKAIHYLKTKQLITLIKHRGNLFNIGSC